LLDCDWLQLFISLWSPTVQQLDSSFFFENLDSDSNTWWTAQPQRQLSLSFLRGS